MKKGIKFYINKDIMKNKNTFLKRWPAHIFLIVKKLLTNKLIITKSQLLKRKVKKLYKKL